MMGNRALIFAGSIFFITVDDRMITYAWLCVRNSLIGGKVNGKDI